MRIDNAKGTSKATMNNRWQVVSDSGEKKSKKNVKNPVRYISSPSVLLYLRQGTIDVKSRNVYFEAIS